MNGCEMEMMSSTPGATRRDSTSLRRPRFFPTTPTTVRSRPRIRWGKNPHSLILSMTCWICSSVAFADMLMIIENLL